MTERLDLLAHEVDDVVRDLLRRDLLHVPFPAGRSFVEPQLAPLVKSLEEAIEEERVAVGFLDAELGEWRDVFGGERRRVGQQELGVVGTQRPELDVADDHIRFVQLAHELGDRMRFIDLVVTIRTDKEDMVGLEVPREALDQFE